MHPLAPDLARLPEGYSEGMFQGHRYRLEKTTFNGGRSVKFYARALDGRDFVSLNLYHLASGEVVKPCEMPEAKVRAFLAQVVLATRSGQEHAAEGVKNPLRGADLFCQMGKGSLCGI